MKMLEWFLFSSDNFLFVYLCFHVLYPVPRKCCRFGGISSHSEPSGFYLLGNLSSVPASLYLWWASLIPQLLQGLAGILLGFSGHTFCSLAYLAFGFSKPDILKLPGPSGDDLWLEILYIASDWEYRSYFPTLTCSAQSHDTHNLSNGHLFLWKKIYALLLLKGLANELCTQGTQPWPASKHWFCFHEQTNF